MDHSAFDAMTKAMAGGAEDRRAILRLLAGSAFGGLLARLGLDDAAAKKRRGKGHHDGVRPGRLSAADKKRRKHKKRRKDRHKDKHPKPDPKPEPEPEPDPDCPLDKFPCPDGTCVPWGTCCALEYRCPNGRCIPVHECCPGKRDCGDLTCVAEGECCEHEKQCDDGSCQSQEECCPGYWECPSGGCVKIGDCCDGMRRCGEAGCIPFNECCDEDPDPECDSCEEVVCVAGEKECRSSCRTEGWICCQGECLSPCSPGWRRNPQTCLCEDIPCQGTIPECGACSTAMCVDDVWTCVGTHQGVECSEASRICCPTHWPQYACNAQGLCCYGGAGCE